MNAILGTSESCIAVHPSDMCVALAVLEATVHVTGPRGERVIAMADFHRLPGDEPQRDNTLAADELVTGIELPPQRLCRALHLSEDPRPALLCLRAGLRRRRPRARGRQDHGGALCPRRRRPQALAQCRGRGRAPRPAGRPRRASRRAADLVLREAKGFGHNDFKIDLARRAIIRALSQAARGTPQSQSNKKIA